MASINNGICCSFYILGLIAVGEAFTSSLGTQLSSPVREASLPQLNVLPIPSLDVGSTSACAESCMTFINTSCNHIPFSDVGSLAVGATKSGPTMATSTSTSLPSFLLNEEMEAWSDGGILSNPSFWAVNIMVSIVGLLYAWEESIHFLRKNIPKALEPVIDSVSLGRKSFDKKPFINYQPYRQLNCYVVSFLLAFVDACRSMWDRVHWFDP